MCGPRMKQMGYGARSASEIIDFFRKSQIDEACSNKDSISSARALGNRQAVTRARIAQRARALNLLSSRYREHLLADGNLRLPTDPVESSITVRRRQSRCCRFRKS